MNGHRRKFIIILECTENRNGRRLAVIYREKHLLTETLGNWREFAAEFRVL